MRLEGGEFRHVMLPRRADVGAGVRLEGVMAMTTRKRKKLDHRVHSLRRDEGPAMARVGATASAHSFTTRYADRVRSTSPVPPETSSPLCILRMILVVEDTLIHNPCSVDPLRPPRARVLSL